MVYVNRNCTFEIIRRANHSRDWLKWIEQYVLKNTVKCYETTQHALLFVNFIAFAVTPTWANESMWDDGGPIKLIQCRLMNTNAYSRDCDHRPCPKTTSWVITFFKKDHREQSAYIYRQIESASLSTEVHLSDCLVRDLYCQRLFILEWTFKKKTAKECSDLTSGLCRVSLIVFII